jgi:SSS family transporter
VGSIDIIIIAAYMIVAVSLGLSSRGKQSNAEDYFTTHGRMTGIFRSALVGLSIAATLFSGISFVAFPSVVYEHGIGIFLSVASFPIAYIILRLWFLPHYLSHSSRAQHPYDIFERRFGSHVRTMAAAMYILLRLGWIALLLYAPSLMLIAAAGLSNEWLWPVLLTIGLTCTFYTVVGGIQGVIVTDAFQFLAVVSGLVAIVVYVFCHLPAPMHDVLGALRDHGSLKMVNFSLNPTNSFTIWAIVIGSTVDNLSAYMADQMSLQRYLATGNVRDATRSFAFNVGGIVIIIALLTTVGLALVAWYHFRVTASLPVRAERVLPYFVAHELPHGISGMIMAALLAATMSSMTGGVNTLAGALTMDFRQRMGNPLSSQEQLKFARLCSIAIGVTATLLSGLVQHLGSVFEIAERLLGVFSGPLFGCMLMAILNLKLDRRAVLLSLIVGTTLGWLVVFSATGVLWTSTATTLITIATAFTLSPLFSLFSPRKAIAEVT